MINGRQLLIVDLKRGMEAKPMLSRSTELWSHWHYWAYANPDFMNDPSYHGHNILRIET